MSEITISLPELHPVQEQIKAEARRFNVVVCGRRFGKDILGHELLIEPALLSYPTAWFAPTYRMMLETFQAVTDILRPLARRINASEHRIELVTGGAVDMWSLDAPDVARGRKYKRAIINEAAMVKALQDAWQKVIRPTLADYVGDAFFLSTPRGINWFKQIYDYGQDPAMADWQSWHFSTGANPFIQPSEIEAMRVEMPARVFEQEILAAFVEDGSFFTNVTNCATVAPQDAALEGHEYVIGVDWARASGGDYTVFVVMDATTKRMAQLVRYNGMAFDNQLVRLKALHERFNGASIIAETNAMGMPLIEQLQRADLPVMPFTTTAATKHEIISALALAFEQGEIAILNDPVLTGELQAFEVKARAGLPSYSAPEGMHDDTVMAFAFAWHGVAHSTLQLYV